MTPENKTNAVEKTPRANDPQGSGTRITGASHTPGPWTARDQGEGPRGKPLGIWISGPDRMPILVMAGGNAKNRANARLIAAAPELLEALREIRRSLSPEQIGYRQICDRAIAKAEGAQ